MSEITEQILVAQGGLNYDDDPRMFGKGDTDYRLNVIPTALGDTYVLTNMKGTTKKEHSFTHDNSYSGAEYTAIGSCYDIKRNAIYFFIYSDSDNHCILRYNIDDDDFDKIVWDNEKIGLDSDYPINDAFMIDDWLYWNPRGDTPRAIQVDWAYYDHTVTDIQDTAIGYSWSVGDLFKYKNRVAQVAVAGTTSQINAGSSNYYTIVDWTYNDVRTASTRYRSFYNTTPAIHRRIQYSFFSDTSYDFNNIRGKVFQFAYRYYIPEQGYTVTSPFTDVIGQFEGESYDGEFTGEVTTNNNIELTLMPLQDTGESGSYSWLFEHIEVLVRDAENMEWRSVVQVPHTKFIEDGPSSIIYNFYNNERLQAVDGAMVEAPYNYLPKEALAQWSLDGERCVYGGVTEGFDIPRLDVTLTDSPVEMPYEVSTVDGSVAQTISFTENTGYDVYDPEQREYFYYTSGTIVLGGAIATNLLIATIQGQDYQLSLGASDVDTVDHYVDAVIRVCKLSGIHFREVEGPAVQSTEMPEELDGGVVVKRYAVDATTTESQKYITFKSGAWHKLCLFYYDQLLRRSEAIPLDPIYINSLPETTSNSQGTGICHYINYNIGHDPPSGARWWRFGYAGNSSVGEFWQYTISGAGLNDSATSVWYNLSYVDISGLQSLQTDGSYDLNLINSTIESYSFEDGDRIRFLTSKDTGATNNSEMNVDVWTSTPHDYEIVDYDADTDRVYFNSNGVIGDTQGGGELDYNDTSVVVEIYRPKKALDDAIYYEIGSLNPVTGTGSTFAHSNAAFRLYKGDAYLITRAMAETPSGFNNVSDTVFVESYSWSDFYKSEMWGKGKPGASFGMGERSLNIVRYSNRLQKDTLAGGVARFDGLDYKNLSYSYGDITGMRQIGNILKVVFENNVASVLVNRTQFFDADGQSQVVKSDDVLGSVNYSEEAWGSVNPESITVVDRNLYFFDLRRKAYVRNAPNGSFPISDYKMRKYFIDKSDALLDSGEDNCKVYSAWDDDRDLLYVGFQDDITRSNNEYVLFHEPQNRWVTFVDPRYLTAYNLVSISDDDLDTTSGDLIRLSLASVFSVDSYTSTVTVSNIEQGGTTFNDEQSFGASNVYTLYAGDTLSIEIEQTIGSQSLDDLMFMDIIGTGSVETVEQNIAETYGSAYSHTTNITETSTIQLNIRASGDQQVVQDEELTFTWSVSITRMSVPLIMGTPAQLLSFSGEDVYLHNDNTTRCNFFGVQKDYTVRIYGGLEAPNIVKTFDSIALHTNAYWDGEDVQIPATINYPNGMESRLPEARFEKEEGVLRSDYLCNMKSTSSTATTIDLFNGDALRGYTIYNDFVGDETTEHTLYKVDILQTQSKH